MSIRSLFRPPLLCLTPVGAVAFMAATFVFAGCTGSTLPPQAPLNYSGVITLLDGKDLVYAEDIVRQRAVYFRGAVAFSYDLKAGEFRILDRPQGGKMSSAILPHRVNDTFFLRRTRADGKLVSRELSLAGSTWKLRTRSPESDVTLRGSSRAIAAFLKLDKEWAAGAADTAKTEKLKS